MSKALNFVDLRLLPGTKLDLRSDQYRVLNGLSQYIGFRGKDIIITTPTSAGKPIPCKPDTEVVVRFFVNHLNCACAFRSRVTHTSALPFHHLFLSVPETMEVGEVRSSVRANVKLPCKVNAHGEFRQPNQRAIIDNLSVQGAKLLSNRFIGDEGEAVSITTKLQVLDVEKIVNINGFIRSSGEADKQFSYGVQFDGIDQTVKLLIYAYVMSEIKT